MSWLRSSPLRQSFTRNNANTNSVMNSVSTNGNNNILRQRPIDTAADCDPRACYDSFCKHWQQAYDIIQRSAISSPTHDDVLGVVSHLDFMVTLLLVELHHCNKIQLPSLDSTPPAPCLEYMLSENLLDKLYNWGCTTGRYANAVRLEQLKLYELLVSHSRHQLLCHEPFLRPLLKLLASSLGEIFPPDLEKRLVILLNQLCVVLMQNVHLLDLFFFSAAQEQYKQSTQNGESLEKYGTTTNFIIFSLLIPYVHREGSLGHQARDALLLCMALSQKNSNIGTYIAQYSSMCPLLVTGLGGLYSRLPNSIEISSSDWHRISSDDVTDIPELTLFMNALEFCNAVVQVAHEMIKQQLLDFMYQGFIVPVLGPAILQTLKGKHFQTNIDSQISAMSYLDLILRSVTEPELLRTFIQFLLDTEKFDGERIIDTLVERLSSADANLCMVTMALFDTLLSLHCEDLMLELLLKYVLPGKHVPIAYRQKINKVEPYLEASEFFLQLTPEVMKRASELTKHKSVGDTVHSSVPPVLPSPTSTMSKTIGANWNYYGLHTGDSLYGNYHAYLLEAHYRITQCQQALTSWANNYKYQKWPPKSPKALAQATELIKQFLSEFGGSLLADNSSILNEKKQLDSLQSIGDSSGYESFKWRPTEEDESCLTDTVVNNAGSPESEIESDSEKSSINIKKEQNWRTSNQRNELLITDVDFSEDLFAQGTVNLGPFLNAIWSKLQTFTSNTLYVNLHLTGLITRLAWYPLPLVHSLLLRPDIVITSDTPSFHQMLRILKQQIDAELPVIEDSLEIVDIARSQLIDREFRLINAHRNSENSPLHVNTQNGTSLYTATPVTTTYAHISSTTPVQVTPSSSYDPFKRNDVKRKSIGRSLSNMFSRKSSNGVTNSNPTNTATTNRISGNGNTTSSQTQKEVKSTHEGVVETSLSTLPIYSISPNNINLTNERRQNTLNTNITINNSEPASLESLSSMGPIANTSGTERTRDLAVYAVLLDEWLRELAAIAQEQSVVLLNERI